MPVECFSERLYNSAQEVWEKSHRHPFLTELRAGTLDPQIFIYYLKQDYVYLIDYAKMFALGSMKAQDLETIGKFAELLHSTLNVEMELHRQYAERFGITREELEATKPAPLQSPIPSTCWMLGLKARLLTSSLPCCPVCGVTGKLELLLRRILAL